MAHGKFGSLSSRLLPLGPRLTLVLPWKGVQGHPPTVPRILGQHLLARLHPTSCCLTSPGQISSRPPLATWRSLSTPSRIAFYFRERRLSPLKSTASGAASLQKSQRAGAEADMDTAGQSPVSAPPLKAVTQPNFYFTSLNPLSSDAKLREQLSPGRGSDEII